MHDLQIAVIAWNRPRYLSVTLQSLFAIRGIGEHEVSVYIDGGSGLDIYTQQLETISGFPVDRTTIYGENRGCLQNVVTALNSLFNNGASEILYIEDDLILRRDTLEYLARVSRDADFYSLFGNGNSMADSYCPIGNVVARETFGPLYKWVQEKRYAGTMRPGMGYKLSAETRSHDAVFYSYLALHGLKTRFPDRSYSAHFGLVGLNHPNPTAADLALEQSMFAGERDLWLPRIVKLIQSKDKLPDDVLASRFIPAHFQYGENECDKI